MDTASPRPGSDRPEDLHDGAWTSAHQEPHDALEAEGHESTEAEDDAEARLSDPTLSELLAGSARGDQPSFATFYEATSDVVYGLALLMHADAEDAQDSTLAIYHHLWDQAEERARDLRLQTQASELLTDEHAAQGQDPENAYRPSEYELVLEWLVPLAHRIIVERFREGLARPISLQAVPQEHGGGVAGLPEEILDDIDSLSDSQTQALALSYLAGGTHQQVAETVGAAVPAVKSRLRDGMTRLHTQRTAREAEQDPILRAAVTKKDVERSGGVNRNFTEEISADVDHGLLLELAEIHALDAIDSRERALLDEAALTADEQTSRAWDTRVLAARRTLAEIFAAHPVVPPSHLLDEVLHNLSDQDVGMGMVESISSHTEEATKRDPLMKRWMILVGLAVVALAAILMIWGLAAGRDVVATADEDPEARVVEGIELEQGGTARAVISAAEDVGYLEFSEVGTLEGEDTYQLWLMPREEGQPSSLGNYSAEELEEEVVTLRGVNQHRALQITVEQIRGAERPMGETVADIPLRERVTEGPQYGGARDDPEDSEESAPAQEPEDSPEAEESPGADESPEIEDQN